MRDLVLKVFVRMQCLKNELGKDESGQDMIEYAIVAGLIAMAATASMKTFATSISTAFSQVGAKLTSYTS